MVDAPFARHFWPFYTMAMSPDGTWFVTGDGDGLIQRWDTATGAPIGDPVRADRNWVLSVAVTPDGEQIISGGGDGTVRRWDSRTGASAGELRHGGLVWAVLVSPNGKRIVAGGGDGEVRRWSARTGGGVEAPATHGQVRALTMTPDGGLIVYGGTEGTVHRWSVADHAPVGEPLAGHQQWVQALVVTPDGKQIVSGSDDGTIRRWDVVTGAPVGLPLTGHMGSVFAVTVTPDGRQIVSGGGDGTIRRWDVVTGVPVGEPLTGHTDWVRAVQVTPDGGLVASCGNDGTIRAWSLATGAPVRAPVTGRVVAVNALAVNRDADEVVSASIDGSIRRWDRATGAARGRLRSPDGWVNAIAISPDNRQLVRVGEDDEIARWDARTHERITPSLAGHAGGVRAVAFTPDSRQIVTVGADGTVRRWDRDTGEPVGGPMTGHRGAVNAVAVTPDGRQLVTAGRNDGAVVLWDVATGTSVWRARGGDRGGALTVAVNRAGDRVVSGGNGGAIDVWDLRSGEHSGSAAQSGVVTVVRFTPDDRHIVSGGADGVVRRWDAESMTPVNAPFTGHVDTVTSLAFPEDTVLLSGSADGTVRQWDLSTGTERSVTPPAAAHGLADVLSDVESSEDRLDIAGDVQRIGAMLAALSVQPPLSVALLGDWGTGKSTFMRQLRDWLARTARQGGDVFAVNIRQVTFNAWHYSDDHLWVGLIEHMFRELARDDTATDEVTADQVVDLKAALSARKAERDRLAADLDAIDRIDAERGWFAALRAPLRSARVARAALASAWRELRGRRGWFTLLVTALATGAVVLTVRLGWSRFVLVGAAVLAVAAPVVTVWRKVTESTEAVRRQLLRRKDELDKDIKAADDELGRLEPAHRLDRLLTEISTAERYESFRGLTGRIHHDLRRLSEDLAAARQEWLDGGTAGRPPLQRIVLYVDDLDRCTPKRVVDVLQAVNLLLTMDLFMVVVAVDPRWLLKALGSHHRALLRDAGRVSPLDYLDKIFHIPFALRPMGTRAGAYLRSMLSVAEPTVTLPATAVPAAASFHDTVTDHGEPGPSLAVAEPEARQPDVGGGGAAPRPVAAVSAERLRVGQAEQDFLAELTALLPTPRAVKKLANLYRLVRLSNPPDRLDAFLGDQDGGPYQAAALLLAALVGAPHEARDLLERLTADPSEQDITDALTGEGLPSRLATLITELRARGTKIYGHPATYRAWATAVARYGFETYDMYTEHPVGAELREDV